MLNRYVYIIKHYKTMHPSTINLSFIISIFTFKKNSPQRAQKMALFFYKTGVNSMQKRCKKWVKWKI